MREHVTMGIETKTNAGGQTKRKITLKWKYGVDQCGPEKGPVTGPYKYVSKLKFILHRLNLYIDILTVKLGKVTKLTTVKGRG